MLKERSGKDSEVFIRAEVRRQLFSKFLNNPDYQPTKSMVIQLALGLQLDLPQTQKLPGKAGYALTRSSTADLVEQYCIEGRIYSVSFINEALYLSRIETGPFYAVQCEPSAWSTFGGIRTDDKLRALKPDNTPMQGLYVVGTDNGSLYYTAPTTTSRASATACASTPATSPPPRLSSTSSDSLVRSPILNEPSKSETFFFFICSGFQGFRQAG